MNARCILDTGPLVAALNRAERHHEWARKQFSELPRPFASCEAVLSECAFLLRGGARDGLLRLFEEKHGLLISLVDETTPIGTLMRKYSDVPMSYADACLVRLSEMNPQLPVVTLDADFAFYRRNRNQRLPLIAPFAQRRARSSL